MKNILARGGIEFLAVFLGIALSLYVDEWREENQIRERLMADYHSIRSAWGQSLNFTNKDSTIIIKPSQLVNLNGTRYTLIHTDYNRQHIVLGP